MLIYDDIYSWEGWGGKLRLASGKCHLRIYDRARDKGAPVSFLRPYVIIVSDTPDSKMSIRSCAGHIATNVTQQFSIDPQRMLWLEYYPLITYGARSEHSIPEQYVAVDFSWYKGKAINPKWRQLNSLMLETVRDLVRRHHETA